MIKPTIGRVVLFVSNTDDFTWGYCICAGKEHAAQIAAVHSNHLVNLSIVDQNGKQFNRTSVLLVQPEDQVPSGGDYCKWMDYQKGQAAKTEILEKQLNEKA